MTVTHPTGKSLSVELSLPGGRPVIAFDVGGTHIRCVVIGQGSSLHAFEKDRLPSVPLGATFEQTSSALLDTIGLYVERVADLVDELSCIAISVPGPVDRNGAVFTAAPLFGSECLEYPLAKLVRDRTGRECHVLNDVSAATWYLSSRLPVERFLVMTVSSGIGSKLFDRTRTFPVLDDTDYAGEIGHVTVDPSPDAPACDCGGRGHLSSFSSGRGVERWARRLAQVDEARFKASLACELADGRADALTNEKHIVPAIREGDEWALGVLRRCTYPLGHMVRTIAVTNAVQKVAVIGGFASSLGHVYMDVLQEALDENRDFAILDRYLDDLLWHEPEVPEECLLGAATYGRIQSIDSAPANGRPSNH